MRALMKGGRQISFAVIDARNQRQVTFNFSLMKFTEAYKKFTKKVRAVEKCAIDALLRLYLCFEWARLLSTCRIFRCYGARLSSRLTKLSRDQVCSLLKVWQSRSDSILAPLGRHRSQGGHALVSNHSEAPSVPAVEHRPIHIGMTRA